MKMALALWCLLVISPVSFAAVPKEVFFPVSNISLSYDTTKSVLHVQADHPSQNWLVDFVNSMTVSVNGAPAATENYSHQTGIGFAEDVSVKAKAGDVVKVDLTTSYGMSGTAQITVEAAEAPSGQENVNAQVSSNTAQ